MNFIYLSGVYLDIKKFKMIGIEEWSNFILDEVLSYVM